MKYILKPCPFCGNEPYVWQCAKGKYDHWGEKRYAVVCGGCQLFFGYDLDDGGWYKTEKDAAANWNRRAPLNK